MRVLTYNIHGWRGVADDIDMARLTRIIQASLADIVGLNEVFHPFVPPGQDLPALDLLADALGMTYAFGVALAPQFAFAPLSAYGNALLTRFPLLAHAGHHLPPVEGHEQRGLLEARILLPGDRATLSVYVTHLDHRDEDVRMKQVNGLLQWTNRDRARPHLLLGDLNSVAPSDYEDAPAVLADLRHDPLLKSRADSTLRVLPRLLRAGYVDVWAAVTETTRPTFPVDEPRVRIDYILASTPLAPAIRSCSLWQASETTLASDHLPVLAEFDLGRLNGK